MPHVLVAYDPTHGPTGQVAQTVADTLRGVGVDARIEHVDHVGDLDAVDAVVLGAPISRGRWPKGARALLRDHHEELAARPVAVFATGPRHDAAEELTKALACVDRALAAAPDVAPRDVRVFSGSLGRPTRGRPLRSEEHLEMRDRDAIRAWARELPETLGVGAR